jgi:hypothetical protein
MRGPHDCMALGDERVKIVQLGGNDAAWLRVATMQERGQNQPQMRVSTMDGTHIQRKRGGARDGFMLVEILEMLRLVDPKPTELPLPRE